MPALTAALAIDTGVLSSMTYGPLETVRPESVAPVPAVTPGFDMDNDPAASWRGPTPMNADAWAVTCQPAPLPLVSLTENAPSAAVVVCPTPVTYVPAKSAASGEVR